MCTNWTIEQPISHILLSNSSIELSLQLSLQLPLALLPIQYSLMLLLPNALLWVPQLNSTNYRQSSFSMRFLLNREDLWNLVRSNDGDDIFGATKKKKKEKVAYLIYQSCSPLPQSYIHRPWEGPPRNVDNRGEIVQPYNKRWWALLDIFKEFWTK